MRKLNPYAVVFRYDDTDIEILTREHAEYITHEIRHWAGTVVGERIAQSQAQINPPPVTKPDSA